MKRHLRFEPDNVVAGSVLRRALPYLLAEQDLSYDPHQPAALNDLIFGEIVRVPARSFEQLQYNYVERLYPHGDEVRLRNELFQPGPYVGVVGNRYAPPSFIGGLTNPITGRSNGKIRGGTMVDSLASGNIVGFVNHQADPGERVRIRVRGVVIDRRGEPVNLFRFREALPDAPKSPGPEPHLIVVAGYSREVGKTTCARALVSGLKSRGFTVTVEKKTGTASCRDWLRCCADPTTRVLENGGDEVIFSPERFPARDFVDGLGIASDVSMSARRFVAASVRYTRAFLAHARPDFHVIELADSISHISNFNLLRSPYFRSRVGTLEYVCMPTHEAAAHFLAYLRGPLGYRRLRVLLSGPLANEAQYEMARAEIAQRLSLRIGRSARQKSGCWIAHGKELASAFMVVGR